MIVGVGGHGKVVLDTVLEMNKWKRIAFLDDCKSPSICGYPVIGRISQVREFLADYKNTVIAIGDNFMRVPSYLNINLNI